MVRVTARSLIIAAAVLSASAHVLPRAPGTQFITGPCQSDIDCASDCCGFNTGKCAGPVIAQERDGGCGFGDATPNNRSAQRIQVNAAKRRDTVDGKPVKPKGKKGRPTPKVAVTANKKPATNKRPGKKPIKKPANKEPIKISESGAFPDPQGINSNGLFTPTAFTDGIPFPSGTTSAFSGINTSGLERR